MSYNKANILYSMYMVSLQCVVEQMSTLYPYKHLRDDFGARHVTFTIER